MNIAGSETETSTNARDLGVTLDRYLTMSTHVDNLCKYASYTLKSIGTIRQCQSVSIKYGKNDTRLCIIEVGLYNSLLYGLLIN